ncbi:AsmA family protein [Geobacter sp. AOG2]|uniref:DUF748 domain-containing protein n=1 Tax=Geobacter sp. AOG2 TaxID=1566347 RepID=UPI001CC7C23D|nr:AsmA family protein [Geobacter sp. AOG2]GFE59428.1 hypothetical protein AOG2_00160 [Geobacter sp. AOG2]
MEDSHAGTYKKILLAIVVAATLLAVALPAILKYYLATPQAASHISQMLSHALGQPVHIEKVSVSDGALHLEGLSLANPEGFPPSKLLSVDSIMVKPLWFTLLSGKRIFEKIAVEGITVTLRRNRDGAWNFSQLQRKFSSSKPSPAELFIRNLSMTKGTLQINDQTFAGLALNISNLATKGSEKSGIGLEFDDPGRNHYALSGKVRLGKDPEFEMAVSSSSISFKSLSDVVKSKSGYLPEKGTARLRLSVGLRKGKIRSSGEMSFSSTVMAAAGRGSAFNGKVSLLADYDMREDRLTIENLAVHLNELLACRASASVRELKRAKDFEITIDSDEIDLGKIAPLIPALEQGKMVVGGRLGKGFVHLAGNAVDGILSAKGRLELSQGSLMRDKRLFFKDLYAAATISGTGDHLTVTGKATQAQSEGGAFLEALNAPFKVTLDRHFKTVTAFSPELFAKGQGVSFTGRLSYANGTGLMENATVKAKDLSVAIGHLSAGIPVKHVSSATVRYPIKAEFRECNVRRGDMVLNKVSGNIRGAYAYDPNSKWLEGTAELSAAKAVWEGKEVGASRITTQFSKSGGKADFTTALLGGSIQGTAAFNPFALKDKVVFNSTAKGIQLAGITTYAGLRGDTACAGGVLEAAAAGTYSLSNGLFCHIEANGKNITVTGKAGKTVLSSAGVKVDSEVSGKKLVINQVLLTAGKGVAVKASGALENAFLRDRYGRIAFTVPRISLTDVVDSFLNLLPRWMQEATAEGSLAAEGGVNLQEGKILVDGAVTLANIGIDAPTEKIKVTGINGVLPLSLDLAGTTAVKPLSSSRFDRQNYDTLVKQLRQAAGKGDAITITSCSFGNLGADSIKIRLRADRGVTEIISLDSSLYEGALLGKGFITTQNGVFYRGDILFNDLSLVQICKAFPAIAGYISGRIDGIVSIQGSGTSLSGITGFTEFWARETSGEKMLVSKEFLQRLSGKKLSGFFFSSDRPYDHAGIKAVLEDGFLSFDSLGISHTNFFGVRDLSVSIAPSQNRIALDHLLNSIKEATVRGKGAAGKEAPSDAAPATEFKWAE